MAVVGNQNHELVSLREALADLKIVFCTGSFDLTHAGHVLFFEDCKKQGDVLVVGVGSDFAIRKNKGEGRPFINEKLRMKMIDSLKPVDYCFLEPSIEGMDYHDILRLAFEFLRPEVYVINEDASDIATRKSLVDQFGVHMEILARTCPEDFELVSTSQIIEKIRRST
jgi:D-beta-D-heptose 7-phosphate kinase / D-beta-D-heptose 1-phosphate adenosyltransferase